MSEFAFLAGFARPIPEILGFATPVLRRANGVLVAQRSDTNGKVDCFREVFADKFQKVDLPLAIGLGDAALHAFEFTDNVLVLGSAKAVSSYLSHALMLSPGYSVDFPRSAAAIERFRDLVATYEGDSDSTLFEFTHNELKDEFQLSSVNPDGAGRLSDPHEWGQPQWLHHIRARLDARAHARSLGGHLQSRRELIRQLAASSHTTESARLFGLALAQLLGEWRVLTSHDAAADSICHECLLELCSLCRSEYTLPELDRCADVLANSESPQALHEVVLVHAAIQRCAVANVDSLLSVRRRWSDHGTPPDEFVDAMERGVRYSSRRDVRKQQLTNRIMAEIASRNSKFDRTILAFAEHDRLLSHPGRP